MDNYTREDFEEMTPEDIEDMRSWALDCMWADLTEEDILEMSAQDLYGLAKRNIDGGIRGFIMATGREDARPQLSHEQNPISVDYESRNRSR